MSLSGYLHGFIQGGGRKLNFLYMYFLQGLDTFGKGTFPGVPACLFNYVHTPSSTIDDGATSARNLFPVVDVRTCASDVCL